MADALVQALIAHFDSVFAGPNGDYPAVLESLAGITAAQAMWKPAPGHNSIWQIADHLRASKIWQIDMLESGQAAPPIWIEPAGGESEWQAAVMQLIDAHARLKDALDRLSESELLAIPEPGSQQTRLELLLSSAAHEAHHAGQVDYLKGLQASIHQGEKHVEPI
jgi:uncharacterized damage-inducible protein DinB